MTEIRAGREVDLMAPREFNVNYSMELAQFERDADRLQAKPFLRKYGMMPGEGRERLRRLRDAAAADEDASDPELQKTMRLLLLVWWPRRA